MNIIIKGMYMPKSCRKCKFCVDLNDYPFKMCFLTETELPLDDDNLDNCPLIEIVTCKDCGYADEYYHCKYTEWWNGNADFCSHGIPRKESR